MEAEQIRSRLAAVQSVGRIRSDITRMWLNLFPLSVVFMERSWNRSGATAAGKTGLWCAAAILLVTGYHWYTRAHPAAADMSTEQLSRAAAKASRCRRCGEPILLGETRCVACGGTRSLWELSMARVACALGVVGVMALLVFVLSRALT